MPQVGASTKFGKGLLLGVAYSCSLGGMACLTGTGTNIAFAGFWATTYGDIDGGAVTFGRWLAFGLPLSTMLILLVWVVLCSCFIGWPSRRSARGQEREAAAAAIRAEAKALGPLSRREKIVLAHFIGQAALWLTRDIGGGGWGLLFNEGMVTDATVAMTTALSLFVFPAGPAPEPPSIYDGAEGRETELQTLRQGSQPEPEPEPMPQKGGQSGEAEQRCLDGGAVRGINWGVVLLLGGGFSLANAFSESGLSAWCGDNVMAPLADLPFGVVTLAIAAAMTAMTEFTSNVATISVALPLLAAAAERMAITPALLLVPATCATSCAFMLPVATPPNAVVFAGGELAVRDMLLPGLACNVLAVAVICVYTPAVAPLVFA